MHLPFSRPLDCRFSPFLEFIRERYAPRVAAARLSPAASAFSAVVALPSNPPEMGFAAFPSTYETLSPLLHERYLLLEEIGVGGSGFVLKVQERQAPGRVLAAKLIARERIARSGLIRTSRWGSVPPGLEADQDGMLVVPVEAWAMRRVAHPNVCGFEELFADETFYYLVSANGLLYG